MVTVFALPEPFGLGCWLNRPAKVLASTEMLDKLQLQKKGLALIRMEKSVFMVIIP
jgi:hypothetical protein